MKWSKHTSLSLNLNEKKFFCLYEVSVLIQRDQNGHLFARIWMLNLRESHFAYLRFQFWFKRIKTDNSFREYEYLKHERERESFFPFEVSIFAPRHREVLPTFKDSVYIFQYLVNMPLPLSHYFFQFIEKEGKGITFSNQRLKTVTSLLCHLFERLCWDFDLGSQNSNSLLKSIIFQTSLAQYTEVQNNWF